MISDKAYKQAKRWVVWIAALCMVLMIGCSLPIEEESSLSDQMTSKSTDMENDPADVSAASADMSGIPASMVNTSEPLPVALQQVSDLPSPRIPAKPPRVPEHYEEPIDYLYGLQSEAAVLLRDGEQICGKDAEKAMYPASITKLVTALVAYDHLDLDEVIGMTEEYISAAFEQDLSIAGFADGDYVTVRDCFYGLLVPSGAECAMLLADQVADSEEEFAVLMNEKAEELGLTASHFTNPYGAHDEEQVITALDAARLLEAVMENPFLREVISTPVYTAAPSENYPEGLTFHHVIVYYLHGDTDWPFGGKIYGGKTGTTTPAGKCLVSYSEIGGSTYILATLGARGEGSGQVEDALRVYSRLQERYEPKETRSGVCEVIEME
ncbi:MAG: D-alanyl-D-alanine carboxypeptidase [Firmicutes bacterium]|nr:D-alanyl-D-alanine carboxypeptidase [Bacillota bacterium]